MKINSELYEDLIGKNFRNWDEPFNGTKYNCWDIVREVYHRLGVELPDVTLKCHEVIYLSHKVHEERDILGDMLHKWDGVGMPPSPSILLVNPQGNFSSHVGVFLGGGKFLHATDVNERGVCIENVSSTLWRNRIEGYYTVKGVESN